MPLYVYVLHYEIGMIGIKHGAVEMWPRKLYQNIYWCHGIQFKMTWLLEFNKKW
jgi:hypothetical protein